MSIPHDIQEFLDGYPDNENFPNSSANLNFYSNSLRCRPDNCLIDEIHNQWKGDYGKLEYRHGYIQWLFPIQEYGMNYESQPLQRHEIESMKANSLIIERIIKSYEMMLDFYGMRLVSAKSGLIDRSLPPGNYANRYQNLVRSPHNNLRISRILKCLAEFNLEHFNVGFLLHLLCEQSGFNELTSPMLCRSMDKWWANCIRNERVRTWMGNMIQKVRKGHVLTREVYQDIMEKQAFMDGE